MIKINPKLMTIRTCIDQKDEIRKNKSEGTKSI